MQEVAAGKKTRLPTVESLTDGTRRRLVAAERRVRRPGTVPVNIVNFVVRRAKFVNFVALAFPTTKLPHSL